MRQHMTAHRKNADLVSNNMLRPLKLQCCGGPLQPLGLVVRGLTGISPWSEVQSPMGVELLARNFLAS